MTNVQILLLSAIIYSAPNLPTGFRTFMAAACFASAVAIDLLG